MDSSQKEGRDMTAGKVLHRALWLSVWLAVAVGVGGAIIGGMLAGTPGVWGALWGAGLAVVFSAVTIASIRLGAHFSPTTFFTVVMGSWLVKLVVFLVVLFALRDSETVDGPVLFFCLVVVVVGQLTIDVFVALTSRQPYTTDSVDKDAKDT